MKAEELRIGNFINYSDYGPSLITKVDGDGFCSFVPYRWSGDIGKMLSEIDPIPLTEDWLKKFGFINHETFWSKTWGTNGVVIITYSQVYKSFMYQLAQSVDKSISTVHQLQNLYYALTGEELTIYEPTKQSEG